MSTSGQDLIKEATEELRRQQERLLKVRAKLADTSTKVRSKDGMVTVTVDARGQLSSINFNSQKFRRIAPAELGSILVETIVQAQAQSRERVLRAFKPLLPQGLDVPGVMAGKTDLNKMFDDAVRESDEMMADGRLRIPGTKGDRK
jgi:DNA-binding protein YbaB